MPRHPPSASDAPINDEDVVKRAQQSNEEACAELLARLIKYHPEHERPVRRGSRDDEPAHTTRYIYITLGAGGGSS
jgi:hypothetical protein